MVKKIQIVQEETSPEEMDQADFQKQLLELLRAMDWKLWELYKLEQERSEREASAINNVVVVDDEAPSKSEKKKPTRRTKGRVKSSSDDVNPIRIEED